MTDFDAFLDPMNIIVHDLKTPIYAVRNRLELMRTMGGINPLHEPYLARIEESLERMEMLVIGLLDISWADSDAPLDSEVYDLNAQVKGVVEQLTETASARGITLSVHLPETPLLLDGELYRMDQVLENLTYNAIKYNRVGGAVTLTLTQKEDHAELVIADTGIGIHPEDVPHIFKPYYRAPRRHSKKTEGTGLGLAIVQGILHKHGGTITVKSVVDQGTTFYITLPLRQPETALSQPDVEKS